MLKISQIILAISLSLIKEVTCIEFLQEQAWIDNRGRDKFFDYAELTESNRNYYNINAGDVNNYSNNVDLELFFVSFNFFVYF